MECYRCGGRMFSGSYCLGCGADLTIYRRIIRASNSCYNAGLEKAKVRDLTGAAAELRKSLQFYKKNTQARNLLGLICYERGELSTALSHWVISAEFDRRDHTANEFINKVYSDRSEFERMNLATKKYNLALKNAQTGNEDFALVSLRRIASQNPRLIRASALLALLYIHSEEYSKAVKVLKAALAVDRGSTICQRYLDEARKASKRRRKSARKPADDRKDNAQKENYAEPDLPEAVSVRIAMAGLLAGVIISVLGYFALIRPTQLASLNRGWGERLIAQNEKVNDSIIEADTLTAEKAQLETELNEVKGNLDLYVGENGVVTNYEKLLSMVNAYFSSEWQTLLDGMGTIEPTAVDSETFTNVYNGLDAFIHSGGIADSFYNSGMDKFSRWQYTAAIRDFQSCLEMDPDNVAAIFRIGLCYEALDDDASAYAYFERIVNEFPDSEFASQARIRV